MVPYHDFLSVNLASTLNNLRGVNRRITQSEATAIGSLSTIERQNIEQNYIEKTMSPQQLKGVYGIDINKVYDKYTAAQLQKARNDMLAVAAGTVSPQTLLADQGAGNALEMFGVKKGSDQYNKFLNAVHNGRTDGLVSFAFQMGTSLNNIMGIRNNIPYLNGKGPAITLDNIRVRASAAEDALFEATNNIVRATSKTSGDDYWYRYATTAAGFNIDKRMKVKRQEMNDMILDSSTMSKDDWSKQYADPIKSLGYTIDDAYERSRNFRTIHAKEFNDYASAKNIKTATHGYQTAYEQASNVAGVYSTYNKGKIMSDSEKGLIAMALAGNLGDYSTFSKSGLSAIRQAYTDFASLELLPIQRGASTKTMWDAINNTRIGASGLTAQAESLQAVSKLKDQLNTFTLQRSSVDKNGDWLDKKGNKLDDKKQVEALTQQITALQMNTPGTPDGATASNGSGMNASVAPPVLNYWNNRWIL